MTGNTLPFVDIRNPKNVVIQAFKRKIEELGPLRVPIDVVREYPTKESFRNYKDGSIRLARKLVVKKSFNNIQVAGVGWDYTDTITMTPNLTSTQKIGWEDGFQLELQIWSPESEDRDNLVELIKLWMLEFEQREWPDGTRAFLDNGIHAVRFIREAESVNNSLDLNGPMYIGILSYSLISEFSGTIENEYERLNFLLNGVINYTPIPGNGGTPDDPGGEWQDTDGDGVPDVYTPGPVVPPGGIVVDPGSGAGVDIPQIPVGGDGGYTSPTNPISHSGCIDGNCEHCG